MTDTIFDGSGWWYLCIECGRGGATHARQADADHDATSHRCLTSDLAAREVVRGGSPPPQPIPTVSAQFRNKNKE